MAAMLGFFALILAFAACLVSAVLLYAGAAVKNTALAKKGAVLTFVCAGLLTLCCGVLLACFLTGNTSVYYVLSEMSHATGSLAWLFKVAGLWGGSQGSLLFWAWLIAVFNALVGIKICRAGERLDGLALAVAQSVLLAFLGVLVFSNNMPFTATPSSYFNADGTLTAAASTMGMNMLLEHWAMAIHPPTLFVGYAGFTVPFAYGVAALALNNSTDLWVRRATPYALVSWIFLTLGIGLGAVWAYVVLGWGGYWGWDPVENASLLPWLIGLALIHSFTVYRQRGAFKRWAAFCACLTFAFVILGTFITRSGVVQSVHAFEGDPVSLYLFLGLIVVSLVVGAVLVILRRNDFCADTEDGDEIESFASKDAAYYVNNLVAVIFAVVLAYFTVASALPSWMPLGGMTVSTGTYESIARPLGILYCALVAVCPLLSWGKTSGKAFWKRALVPAICAAVVFAVLMTVFFTKLLPAYNAVAAAGGTAAADLAEYGPAWYYNGLAAVGLLVASLLFFNAGFMLVKLVKGAGDFRAKLASIGGALSHLAMAVILVGLIGSSMYVTEQTFNLVYDEDTDTVDGVAQLGEYTLTYAGSESDFNDVSEMVVFTVVFDVDRNGQPAGQIAPTYEVSMRTYQNKLDAGVLHYFGEDLFVVFNGLSSADSYMIINVRVNPLIAFVWVGFGLLALGMILALGARRTSVASKDGEGTKASASASRAPAAAVKATKVSAAGKARA